MQHEFLDVSEATMQQTPDSGVFEIIRAVEGRKDEVLLGVDLIIRGLFEMYGAKSFPQHDKKTRMSLSIPKKLFDQNKDKLEPGKSVKLFYLSGKVTRVM